MGQFDGKQIKGATITKDKLNLVDPVNATDPGTKQWIQAQIDGALFAQDWKSSARVASTGNVSITVAPASIDGVSLNNGDRVLLKNQTTGAENGIRVFTAAGAALNRATDFDSNAEVTSGAVVPIAEGTVNAKKNFKLTTADPIVLGTTALVFEDFNPTTTSPVPTTSNKSMAAVATTNDGDVACNTGIASTPPQDSFVLVFINGVMIEVGDGVKTKEAYFSGNSGTTARALIDITSGDKLYWNGSIAGYQLAATDRVDFGYVV